MLFIPGAGPAIPGPNPLAYEVPGQVLRFAGITGGSAARFRWFQGPEGLRVRPLSTGALVFHPSGESELCEAGNESRACERTSEWVSEVKVLLRDLWYGESLLAGLKDE